LLLLVPCAGYKYVANCVPGEIAGSLNQTKGLIIGYVKALQTILPDIYGDMKLMAVGDSASCGLASTDINSNFVTPDQILKLPKTYPNMHEVGILKGIKKANFTKSYLYVFTNKYEVDYSMIANCVPGSVAATLNQTKGLIIAYTKALQTILPSLYGDMKYLGVGESDGCIDAMNAINQGNHSVYDLLKKGTYDTMSEVGILKGLKKANENKSYLYVFNNGMWNGTWNIMSAGPWGEGLTAITRPKAPATTPIPDSKTPAESNFEGIMHATSSSIKDRLLRI